MSRKIRILIEQNQVGSGGSLAKRIWEAERSYFAPRLEWFDLLGIEGDPFEKLHLPVSKWQERAVAIQSAHANHGPDSAEFKKAGITKDFKDISDSFANDHDEKVILDVAAFKKRTQSALPPREHRWLYDTRPENISKMDSLFERGRSRRPASIESYFSKVKGINHLMKDRGTVYYATPASPDDMVKAFRKPFNDQIRKMTSGAGGKVIGWFLPDDWDKAAKALLFSAGEWIKESVLGNLRYPRPWGYSPVMITFSDLIDDAIWHVNNFMTYLDQQNSWSAMYKAKKFIGDDAVESYIEQVVKLAAAVGNGGPDAITYANAVKFERLFQKIKLRAAPGGAFEKGYKPIDKMINGILEVFSQIKPIILEANK